jgi:hypothetical protein
MENSQLQKVAEQVIDVEARIVTWDGNITEWARDLIRLRALIQQLLTTASTMRDTTQEDFLKCLLQKTNRCWENVLSRARWMVARHNPVTFIDGIHTDSDAYAEAIEPQHTR